MLTDRFIPVFIDAKPNEVLHPASGKTLCFVGLLCSDQLGVPGLRQYKNTRTAKRKIDAANKIVSSLKSGWPILDVVAVAGAMNGTFARWACDAINVVNKKLDINWMTDGSTPRKLQWEGQSYDTACAMGLSLYAGILPLIGLRARLLSRTQDTKKIKLFLDKLPHSSGHGSALMQAVAINNPDISWMWQSNLQCGNRFEIGVLESYVDNNGVPRSAKQHPNFTLADWLANACLAKINPAQIQSESKLTDNEVSTLAAIWDAANRFGTAHLIDVDDPGLIANVKSQSAV